MRLVLPTQNPRDVPNRCRLRRSNASHVGPHVFQRSYEKGMQIREQRWQSWLESSPLESWKLVTTASVSLFVFPLSFTQKSFAHDDPEIARRIKRNLAAQRSKAAAILAR